MIYTRPQMEKGKADQQADTTEAQEPYQHECLRIRELVLDDLNYGQDAAADLLRGVTVIVGAHPQHNNLHNKSRIPFRTLCRRKPRACNTVTPNANKRGNFDSYAQQ